MTTMTTSLERVPRLGSRDISRNARVTSATAVVTMSVAVSTGGPQPGRPTRSTPSRCPPALCGPRADCPWAWPRGKRGHSGTSAGTENAQYASVDAPGRIRTSDQQLRRLLLYPPELRARVIRQQLNTRCHTKGAAGGALKGITCSPFGYGVNSHARPRNARSVV